MACVPKILFSDRFVLCSLSSRDPEPLSMNEIRNIDERSHNRCGNNVTIRQKKNSRLDDDDDGREPRRKGDKRIYKLAPSNRSRIASHTQMLIENYELTHTRAPVFSQSISDDFFSLLQYRIPCSASGNFITLSLKRRD